MIVEPLVTPLPPPSAETGMLYPALFYDALGWLVVRLRFGTKALHPVGPAGRALVDHVLRGPDAIGAAYSGDDRFDGIGLVQGPTTVVDYDRKNGEHPRTEIAAKCAELGVTLPTSGPIVRTPRGEQEYYAGAPLSVCHGYVPGIDVQARGSYVVAPPTHLHPATYDALPSPDDPREPRRRAGWTDPRPWLPYVWVRPEVPRWSDDVPEAEGTGVSFDAVAGTAAPLLTPDDYWWPTGRELLDAVNGAVLPEGLVADIRATPSRAKAASGRSGGVVPVEEWRRTGIPRDYPETQRHALVCVAASCTRRGLHPERDTLPILREIADASPVLRPTRPWTDTDLRFIAHNVANGTDARTARDNARARELAATVDWEIPS